MDCLNCGMDVKQTPGKKTKLFCNVSCRSNYWQMKKRKEGEPKKRGRPKKIVLTENGPLEVPELPSERQGNFKDLWEPKEGFKGIIPDNKDKTEAGSPLPPYEAKKGSELQNSELILPGALGDVAFPDGTKAEIKKVFKKNDGSVTITMEPKKAIELKAALGVMFFDHKGNSTGYVLGTDPYRKEGEEQAPPNAVSVEKKIEDLLYRPDSAQAQKEAFTDLIDTGKALTLVTPDKVERIAPESPEARKLLAATPIRSLEPKKDPPAGQPKRKFDGISRISNPPMSKEELDKKVAEGIERVKAGMFADPVRSFRDYMDLIKEGKFNRNALRKEVQEDKKLTPAQKSMLYAKLQ